VVNTDSSNRPQTDFDNLNGAQNTSRAMQASDDNGSSDAEQVMQNFFNKKGCPGWGVDSGSFDFVYFLIPSL
jgi:hypothetical protein